MPQNTTNANFLLKTVYGPGIRNAVNTSSAMFLTIQRKADKIDWEGENYVWSIRTGRSASTRGIAEGGKVPPADRQRGGKASQATFETVHTIKLTRKVIRAARSNRGALLRTLDDESTGAEEDLMNDLNRQIVGRASVQTATPTVMRTGVLGWVKGAPAADVITLDDSTGTNLTVGEMRFFFEGMTVTAIDPTDGTVTQANMTIVSVDEAAATITVDADGSTADNDILVRGDANANAYTNEFPGLRVLINDATGDKIDATNTVLVHGLSSATNSKWQSQVVSGPISESLLQSSYTRILTSGNGRPDASTVVFGSHEQQDELAAKLIALRRYEGRQTQFQTGWDPIDALKLSQGVFIPDRYMPTNTAFRLSMSDIAIAENSPMEWDEEDGQVLFKTDDELAYEARFVCDMALVALNRNSHARINFDAIT